MIQKLKVGIIGATGMVGQRLLCLLKNHPWFEVTCLAASPHSAGQSYEEAVQKRWKMTEPLPETFKNFILQDGMAVAQICAQVDFVFCAISLNAQATKELEEAYALHETPVISNNSAHRWTPDVPMLIPEINPQHAAIIEAQRQRLGTKHGFIAVKSNCSIQSYVPPITALLAYKPKSILACTYQAISGAGKTLKETPELMDNVIPYIPHEEAKSEQEPLKIWGHLENHQIVPATSPLITTQCLRVPVSDGHLAAVYISFHTKPTREEILQAWQNYVPPIPKLPSSPKEFLHYFEEVNRPQPKLDRLLGNGMTISMGRLREDCVFDYKFICLSHNTLRGAAGGSLLSAEYLTTCGYLCSKASY